MPHIILAGPVTPEDIWLAFQPMEFAEGATRYKAQEALLSSDKQTLLVRSLVVERAFVKSFFVRIIAGEGTINIGLEPQTRPDLSDGVKRLLGIYAWKITQVEPTESLQSTNIPDFLGEPRA